MSLQAANSQVQAIVYTGHVCVYWACIWQFTGSMHACCAPIFDSVILFQNSYTKMEVKMLRGSVCTHDIKTSCDAANEVVPLKSKPFFLCVYMSDLHFITLANNQPLTLPTTHARLEETSIQQWVNKVWSPAGMEFRHILFLHLGSPLGETQAAKARNILFVFYIKDRLLTLETRWTTSDKF